MRFTLITKLQVQLSIGLTDRVRNAILVC